MHKELAAKHNLIQMAKVGSKFVYIGDIQLLRSQNNYSLIKRKFFVYRHDCSDQMNRMRWDKAMRSDHVHIVMTPRQWEQFREWADKAIDWDLLGPTVERWEAWGDGPPEYVHHPKWKNARGYENAVSFGLRKNRTENKAPWAWSDALCMADTEKDGVKHRPLDSRLYSYIYDRQSDGRFKLRRTRSMTEATKPAIQSTTALLKTAIKDGGKIVAADRVNIILCDKGVKRLLIKLGFSEEFLKTEAGDLVIRWLAPTAINQLCVSTNLIPRAEFVSAACGEAMKANTIHTLGPIIDKAMPMLTALAEVGKEIVEETKDKAQTNVEDAPAPAVQ